MKDLKILAPMYFLKQLRGEVTLPRRGRKEIQQREWWREFPGSPTVRTRCFHYCGQVQSLVWELSYWKLHSMARGKKKIDVKGSSNWPREATSSEENDDRKQDKMQRKDPRDMPPKMEGNEMVWLKFKWNEEFRESGNSVAEFGIKYE